MLREPEFFKNTLFVIDTFHASGHTRCTPSAFATNYGAVDPTLAVINTSAAECGNGGMLKIRKSVSYMGQDRAVVYTRTYISMWNRVKMLKLLRAAQLASEGSSSV